MEFLYYCSVGQTTDSQPLLCVSSSSLPQYFQMKFTCPHAHGNHTVHCKGFNTSFENWFSVVSMIPIFLMSAVNVWLQSKSVIVHCIAYMNSALLCIIMATITYMNSALLPLYHTLCSITTISHTLLYITHSALLPLYHTLCSITTISHTLLYHHYITHSALLPLYHTLCSITTISHTLLYCNRFHYRVRMSVSVVVMLTLFLVTTVLVGVPVTAC